MRLRVAVILLGGLVAASSGCDSSPAESERTPPPSSQEEAENTGARLPGGRKTENKSGEQNRPSPPERRISGEQALEHVRNLVRYGERWPGSPGHVAAQEYIIRRLRLAYATIEEVDFVAQTPDGLTKMTNIIGKVPGRSSDIVVVAGHYDTWKKEGFVGANDGGSSTALLLELARVLGPDQPHAANIWFVFFDGEEALRAWSESDGLYGSRYQVSAWKRAGVLERIRAVIVLDMVGDEDLTLKREVNSSDWLVELIWRIAREKGYGEHFLDAATAIEDDHVPFVEAGVPAVNLIDLQYGPGNRYWHTTQDTVDKLSSRSFEMVGEVVLEAIRRLSQRWPDNARGGEKQGGEGGGAPYSKVTGEFNAMWE